MKNVKQNAKVSLQNNMSKKLWVRKYYKLAAQC